MLRSTLSVLFLSLSALCLGACTKEDTSSDSDKSADSDDDDDKDTSSSSGSKKSGKSTDKDTTKPKGDDDDSETSVGPNCTAYLECCEDLAEDQPSVADSCDTMRKAIEDAVDKGASADSYEAGCKSAVTSWKSAGYCK